MYFRLKYLLKTHLLLTSIDLFEFCRSYKRFSSGISLAILKSGSHLPKKFPSMKSIRKWWEVLFISPLKLFSFSRFLNFCLDFLLILKKQLDQKDKFSLTIYVVTIHILPNVSQSKCSQTMKVGKLIQYLKKNIFLQKLCKK